MKKYILVFLFLVSADSYAKDSILDGNGFLNLCTSNNEEAIAVCTGYLVGYLEATRMYVANDMMKEVYCLPDGVTETQLYKVFIKYLEDNPSQTHLPTMFLMFRAYSSAYPCS